MPDVQNLVAVAGHGPFATNDYAVAALADHGSFALAIPAHQILLRTIIPSSAALMPPVIALDSLISSLRPTPFV